MKRIQDNANKGQNYGNKPFEKRVGKLLYSYMSSTLIPTLAASAKNALVALWSADISAMRFTFISTAMLTMA